MLAIVFALIPWPVPDVMLSDLDRFSGAVEHLKQCPTVKLMTYRNRLASRAGLQAGWIDAWQREIREADRLYLCWDALMDANAYGVPPGWTLGRLRTLRCRIGNEAYYRGEMPLLPEGVNYTDDSIAPDVWREWWLADYRRMPNR